MTLLVECKDHPEYRGIKLPEGDCNGCWALHDLLHDPHTGPAANLNARPTRSNGYTIASSGPA